MIIEKTLDGYWLARGERYGRMRLAEGDTRKKAMNNWCLSQELCEDVTLTEGVQENEGKE